MKNKTVKMVLAVVVLGVCCGAYAGVKTYVAHQEQKESEEDSEESTTVFTASTDNIKSLDFMVDDTETTFEKDDDSWVKKDETDFPVNQTTLDSAASAIASVDSDRVLEDVDDLSEYGLDSPSNTIKIVTKSDEEDGDDITTTLYVGDENSSTSQYYVRKDDDEKTVYLIDSSCVEPFAKSLNDYAQMEDFPAISNTLADSGRTASGADKLEDMINFLIPNYVKEGKTNLVIAIGCTGGKHRSVTLARELYSRLSGNTKYGFRLEHRDAQKDRLVRKQEG